MRLWSFHPLRARWHRDLMLFNKYADPRAEFSRLRSRAAAAEEEQQAASVIQEEEEEQIAGDEAASGDRARIHGSGVVGSATADSSSTARRRRGPLTQLYHERQAQAQAEAQAQPQPSFERKE